MTARHDLTKRLGPDGDVSSDEIPASGSVESVSTRILLNGGGRECRECDGNIDTGTRYKCLTVRDDEGGVAELAFCTEDCLGFSASGQSDTE